MTIKRYLLTTLCALTIGASLHASYEYDFSNFLSDAIVLRINQRRVDNKDYYQIVNSFETVKQVFNNAYCLEKISWAPWDGSKPLRGGMDLVDRASGRIPEEKQRQFGDVVAPRYAFSPIEIKMQSSAVFQKTREAAAKLLQGIDNMGCQLLNEVKSFTGITMGENFGKGLGNSLGGHDNINVIPGLSDQSGTNTGSLSNTDLLHELEAVITRNNQTEIESFVSTHMNQLKTIFSGPTGPSELSQIKSAWKSVYHGPALELVRKKLQNSVNTSVDFDSSFDIDGFESSGFGNSLNSNPNKAPLKDPNKCSFGLGRIGDASGKLAGYTLCKSRQFLIAPKVDKDGLPVLDYRLGGRMKVIAITVEGE
jgi:hypothetical protein